MAPLHRPWLGETLTPRRSYLLSVVVLNRAANSRGVP
jgi:hypothetical protein